MKATKTTENDKCPLCRDGWQDFIIVNENLWACEKCGCVFVPKALRVEHLATKKERIGRILKEPDLKCSQCDFIAKSEHGLKIHLRVHRIE